MRAKLTKQYFKNLKKYGDVKRKKYEKLKKMTKKERKALRKAKIKMAPKYYIHEPTG